ncbi:hypothetical protein BGY98DRAFT_982025 [Russula aff. rugulosa BPL654]|nr:hypothetical protein BGY98DRAFT_982025 [Russula aff. rugulosa BPL654]
MKFVCFPGLSLPDFPSQALHIREVLVFTSRRDPHFTPKRTRTDPGASFTRHRYHTNQTKWEMGHNRERRRVPSLDGSKLSGVPIPDRSSVLPTQRKHMAACPRSCTCSHLPHLETPTTHFIVMSSTRASHIHETDVFRARYHIMMRNTPVGRAGPPFTRPFSTICTPTPPPPPAPPPPAPSSTSIA